MFRTLLFGYQSAKLQGEMIYFALAVMLLVLAGVMIAIFTERRRRAEAANAAVRESEARLAFLAEHMSDLVVRYDRNGVRTFVSAICRRYGYEPEELIGRTALDLNHPDDRPRLAALSEALLAGSEAAVGAVVELRARTKSGEWAWLEGAPNLIRDAKGEVVEIAWVLRDISARKAAEAALSESEERYRLLAESATDIILRYNPSGVIEFASPSVSQIGYRPEELIGRNTLDLFTPTGSVNLKERLDQLVQGRLMPGADRGVVGVRRPDGQRMWLEGKPSRIMDSQGAVVGVVTVLRDVTARCALERELERQRVEAEASALLAKETHRIALMAEEVAGIGNWSIDVKSGAVHWSDGVFRIFGLDPKDGVPPLDVLLEMYDPADRGYVRHMIGRAVREGLSYTDETKVTRRDGAIRHIKASVGSERNADGDVVTVFGIMIDVTEARLREDALRESEARYRMLTDQATDIIVRYDTAGVIEFASPSIAQLGFQPEDMVGQNIVELAQPQWKEQAQASVEHLGRGLMFREAENATFRARKADGDWIWLEGSPAAIRNDAGDLIGVMTVLRDVSARRAIEDELRRKRAEAEAAARAKSEFLANMSHEIRTPLTGVIGFAGLLSRMPDLSEKAQAYAKRITTGGQALLFLVNDILDFSRLEAGQIELNPQPVDLKALLEDTIELVRHEAEAKHLDLNLRLAQGLPSAVLADGERLRQVLLNLIGNAIKFTVEGSVVVEAGPIADGGDMLRFTVKDTGVGIPADYKDRLFQRFSQVDTSNTRRFGGAGLGLAISKGLVELMGGDIGADSIEDQGSTFWFTLRAPVADIDAPEEHRVEDGVDIAPLRILVVDDVAGKRELVTSLLSAFELQLTEAANGAEAVEAARRDPFDLILMDLQMPVLDGLAATRAIRANSALNTATPILAVSANVMSPQVEACMAAGMNDHIAKPIDLQSLLKKIAQWTSPTTERPLNAKRRARSR